MSHLARVVDSRASPTPVTNVGLGPQSASLEGLPVELKWIILQNLPCLPSLNAVVHASPSYHKAYMARRQYIFAEVVSQDIGQDMLFEASAVARSLRINSKDAIEVRAFVKDYFITRLVPAPISLGGLSLPDLITFSQFQYVVRFAVKDFCQATLSKHPLNRKEQEYIAPLSTNEARRISRAFYRFETYCTIFSQKRWKRKLGSGMCHLFLHQFPPWELEEIACVRDYIIDRYAHMFARHEHELVQQSQQRTLEDSSEDDMPFEDIMLEYYEESCMSRGLGFLRRISQASPSDQVSMLRKNLIQTHFFLTRVLEEEPDDYVDRTTAFDDWIDKLPLRFADDSDGPNAAWTWSNGDIVELFHFLPSKKNLRKWGYVMWDKERLDRWGVLESSNEQYVRQCYE